MLQKKGTPTAERLKRLYRRLCREMHPDLSGKSHKPFVQLHEWYEDALHLLSESATENSKNKGATRHTVNSNRENVLKTLYRYALKFNGVQTQQVFSDLLEQVKEYRPAVYPVLLAYQTMFLRSFSSWQHIGEIYYTHALWIASIRELAYYLSFGQRRYRILLERYIQDLKGRAAKIDEEKRDTLPRLGSWLIEEADGNKIQIIFTE
jgi:hypothetical protein